MHSSDFCTSGSSHPFLINLCGSSVCMQVCTYVCTDACMQRKWALLEGAWSAEYVPHIRARKVSYLWEGALHVLYTWVTEYCQGRKTRPAASNHKYCFSSIWLARARARPLSPPRGKWFEFFMSDLPAFISGLGQVCCLIQ